MIGTRGSSLTFEGSYFNAVGTPTNPVDPGVVIVNPADQAVVTAVPTQIATGRYSYTYQVPIDARLGLYLVQWSGTIDSAPTFGAEAFEVLAAGVAPWITPDTLADEPRLTNLKLPASVTHEALCQAATDMLWRWSGRKYNALLRTVRPMRLSALCSCGWWGFGAGAVVSSGDWLCGCAAVQLDLPGPAAIESVKVDGATLAPSSYTLYDGHLLVRTDGLGAWPCCQSLTLPDTAQGTFSVTYTQGTPPPTAGVLACREYAVHLAMDLSGKPTKLPNRTRSVSRDGVSVEIASRSDGNEKTGIRLVDDWVASENPDRRTRRPQVVSPDSVVVLSQ